MIRRRRSEGAGRRARFATGATALAMLALAGCSSSEPADGGAGGSGGARPAPFVLVHGAWMGAWAWGGVAAGLEAEGADVEAVELPAHGADQTPVAEVTLDAYVARVSAAVEAQSEPVVLVAHSMGGVVVTQVAEQMPDRIAKLVYLAAFVPKEGDTLQTLAGMDAGSHIGPVLEIDGAAGVAKLPAEELGDIFCADCDAASLAQLESSYRDEPLAPFGAEVHPTAGGWGKVAKFYVFTENDNAVSHGLQQSMTSGVELASTATLETSHSPFLSDPALVVSTLLGF